MYDFFCDATFILYKTSLCIQINLLMKRYTNKTAFILILFFAFACKDQIKDTYLVNEPIYMSYETLRSSFDVKSAEDIIQPGKIYFKDHLIFVNEYQRGIHVIDNVDPSNPVVLKFIELPGTLYLPQLI